MKTIDQLAQEGWEIYRSFSGSYFGKHNSHNLIVVGTDLQKVIKLINELL
jgi:hypothetical protein